MRILSLKADSAVVPCVVCAFGGCVTISGRGAESAASNSAAEQVDARLYLISQMRRRPFEEANLHKSPLEGRQDRRSRIRWEWLR